MLQYLLATNSTYILVGGFNYDLLKVLEKKIKMFLQCIYRPYLLGTLIYHVYVKKTLMEEIVSDATIENIYFPDHDAVAIVIEKTTADFHANLYNRIWPVLWPITANENNNNNNFNTTTTFTTTTTTTNNNNNNSSNNNNNVNRIFFNLKKQ